MIDDFFYPVPLRPTALFYLGLLPVILLLWAWADSLRIRTTWSKLVSHEKEVTVVVEQAHLDIQISRIVPVQGSDPPPELLEAYPAARTAGVFTRDRTRVAAPPHWYTLPSRVTDVTREYPFDFETRFTTIPLWLILACYLPPWLAISWWHARRKQKSIAAALSSPAQPQQ